MNSQYHFRNEKTEVQKIKYQAQCDTAGKQES